MKLSYLGPAFTFSETAAQQFGTRLPGSIKYEPLISADAVAHSLVSERIDDRCEYAVIPYYNYLEGLVQECLDLIYENNLYICDAQRIPVTWALGAGKRMSADDKIYSHPKALAQCSEYLWKHFPNSRQIPVSSTAEGVEIVKEQQAGLAVANRTAISAYDLDVIAADIGNKRHGRTNFTDFYLLRQSKLETFGDFDNHFTMIAVTPHEDRPGLLAEILGKIGSYGLNNAKIHSRPAIDNIAGIGDPQMFYLEIMQHSDNAELIRCITAIQECLQPRENTADIVRVLGTYRRPDLDPIPNALRFPKCRPASPG